MINLFKCYLLCIISYELVAETVVSGKKIRRWRMSSHKAVYRINAITGIVVELFVIG